VYAKERVWEWVKDEYEVKKVSRPKKKPVVEQEEVDVSFFHNPFNLRVA
jgi:predicted GIY-YIG superfamily endonuclease